MSDDALEALRAALRVSPDNIPLRKHFAESLAGLGRLEEAIVEYNAGLKRDPDNTELKIGLATVHFRQRQDSLATVIVESMIQQPDPPARARLLYARILLRSGDAQRAVYQYRQAVDADPSVADSTLEEQLGLDEDESGRAEVVGGRVRSGPAPGSRDADSRVELPKITFDDVGGMDALKEEIRLKIILPLTNPELYEAYGKKVGGGILMYGPPGCGKTFLARATAGTVQAGFVSIGLHDVLEMWIGQSERNLHEVFEEARSNAPCVLFFDEVDALGASRSDMRQSAGRQVINQFLSELDGANASNEGVLILAATNAPWHLDSAFRRPGRFDRVLFVPPPDESARAAILSVLLKGKPAADVDCDYIARKTPNFSGADLKAVVDRAIEAKLEQALRERKPAPITTKELKAAIKSTKPTTAEWLATARNYALYSNQGGIYDDIVEYLKLK